MEDSAFNKIKVFLICTYSLYIYIYTLNHSQEFEDMGMGNFDLKLYEKEY